MNEIHYSSDRHDWETPQPFFDLLNDEFGFTLDACATADNAKCWAYLRPEDDALSQRWEGVVWMNPPYGGSIKHWVKKAYEESQNGATVVALIPARTDTSYWHDYVMNAAEIRLVRGRLIFRGATENAPFPNAVIVFKPGSHTPKLSAMDRSR